MERPQIDVIECPPDVFRYKLAARMDQLCELDKLSDIDYRLLKTVVVKRFPYTVVAHYVRFIKFHV